VSLRNPGHGFATSSAASIRRTAVNQPDLNRPRRLLWSRSGHPTLGRRSPAIMVVIHMRPANSHVKDISANNHEYILHTLLHLKTAHIHLFHFRNRYAPTRKLGPSKTSHPSAHPDTTRDTPAISLSGRSTHSEICDTFTTVTFTNAIPVPMWTVRSCL